MQSGVSMKIWILVVFLCASVSAHGTDSTLGFPIFKKYDFYILKGNTQEEIEISYETERPKSLKRENLDGYTSWEYKFWTDDETCEIKQFSLEVTYKIPRLVVSKFSPETSESYREYLEALYRHEEIHCAIATKITHEMYLAFKEGQHGSCAKQNEVVIALESQINEDNELFDTFTNHGEIELTESHFGEEGYLSLCKIPYSPIANSI